MASLTRARPREQTMVNFASLGILMPLLDKLNIANLIDRHLPKDPQAEYSHGTVLNVLLAARLNHPTALVNVAETATPCSASTSVKRTLNARIMSSKRRWP